MRDQPRGSRRRDRDSGGTIRVDEVRQQTIPFLTLLLRSSLGQPEVGSSTAPALCLPPPLTQPLQAPVRPRSGSAHSAAIRK